ncbi:MAG: hypothetical protein LBK54_03355, partial [Propionibacteriaceae bacterium]|nr:hypothetical protein [Propionibacteriaceae bacterium]
MNQSPSSPPSASPPERPEAGQTEVVVPIKGHWRWSALLGVLGMVMVCFVGTTLAVFVDIESGSFDVSVTVPPQVKLRPVASHLASTTLAIDDQGRAVIWGYRDQGISGTGVSTVGTSSDASIVALPEGRRIVLLTGGNEDGSTASVYYTKYTYVVALDDRGQVWTWGFDDNYMGGRTPTGDWPRNKPGPVVLPPPFDSSKDQVVDIKASTPTTVVLTKLGDVWIWGNDWHGTAGIGINVTGAGPQPRRILTGIHSIGTGYWAGWAVAAPDWTYTTYEDKDDFKGAQSAKKAQGGLLFWGWQQTGQSGGPAGDGRASADYRTPSLVAADSPLSLALAAGTAAGDDNATLGVRAGSADDKGT